MVEININPTFFIGFLEVRWATLMLIVAILVVIAMCLLEAKRRANLVSFDIIFQIILAYLIGGFIGGRFFYILDNWQTSVQNPIGILLAPWVVMYGVVIGAIAGVTIMTMIKRMVFWETGDNAAPGVMLGLAIYRIGCVINGCCYGVPTTLPWAVVYTNLNAEAPFGKLLHPTQVYHLLTSFLIFVVLWLLRKKLQPVGSLFLLMLILLAATDLPIRLFRAGQPFLLGLQQAQVAGIITLLVAVPWFIIKIRSHKIEYRDNY